MTRRLTKRERIERRVRLLQAIRTGAKHTRANAVLAPLSQADLIAYDAPPPHYRATNVRLTVSGEVYLDFYAGEYGIDLSQEAP